MKSKNTNDKNDSNSVTLSHVASGSEGGRNNFVTEAAFHCHGNFNQIFIIRQSEF